MYQPVRLCANLLWFDLGYAAGSVKFQANDPVLEHRLLAELPLMGSLTNSEMTDKILTNGCSGSFMQPTNKIALLVFAAPPQRSVVAPCEPRASLQSRRAYTGPPKTI